MDEPVRLNAAQMANRNVKSAKGRRKAPLQSNPAVPQSMSFGGGGGGGLFGGSVQATGTFDFSAPSGGLSFPPSPFGSNNAFGKSATTENDDPRADTTGEEAARRNKAFRDAPPRPASTPVQSSIFGQSQQSNPFSSMKGIAEQANNPFAIQYTSQPVSGGESKSKSQAEQANNPFTIQYTSQPASPGFTGFNSAPVQDKPASNIFAFGGSPSQPTSPSPVTSFNSGASQDKPTSNIFTFGQNATQPTQPTSSIFKFGSPAPQDKPASSLFSFNQNATQPSSLGPTPATQNPMSNLFGTSQPSSSGINFGFTPAAEKPITNMFGTSQPQPIPSSNLFAPAPQSPASSTNIFAHLSAPASPSNNLFTSEQEPKAAATPDTIFRGQVQQPPTASNFFGNSDQTSASPNLFGGQNSATPSNSLFSHLNKPAETSSTPSQEQTSATSSKSLFSRISKPDETSSTPSQERKSEDLSTNSLFSNLNKPVQSTSNLFGGPKSAPTSSLFGGKPATSTNDLFGNLNKPVDQPAPQSKVNGTAVNGAAGDAKTSESSTSSLFNKAPASNIFGGSSSLFPPRASQEASTGSTPNLSFGTSQPSAPAPQTSGKAPFSAMKPIEAPSSASQPPPSGMFPNLLPPTSSKSGDVSNKPSTSTALTAPKPSTSNTLVNGNTTEDVDYDSLYAEMAAASLITDQQLSPMVPARFSAEQKNEFYTAYRLRSLNKAIEKVFGSVTFGTDISNLIAYYNQKKAEILDRSSLPMPGSKRKSSDDEDRDNENPTKRSRQNPPQTLNLFQPQSSTSSQFQPQASTSASKRKPNDEDQENENPTKRSQQEAPSNSNVFQPQPQAQTFNSPEKSRSEDQPYLNGGSIPKAPLFAPQPSFVPPTASPSPGSLASPLTKSKRKAEVQLTKDDDEREEQEGRWKQNSNAAGSTTSNMFKSIVDSPSKASPGKKVKSLPSASPSKEDAPRINPFSNLPVPKSSTKAAQSSTSLAAANATSNTMTNMFTPKPTSDASNAATNMFAPKIASEASSTSNATTNIFAPKPASNALNLFAPKPASNTPSTISNPGDSQSGAIKPPQFGPPKFAIASGASAMAQFAAKAKQSEEEKERKLLEEAVMDEFDSDEDEEVVKAFKKDWIEKRKTDKEAKKKELEEISKNGKGFVPDTTKELVTQSAADSAKSWQFSAGNSISNSRTSTPGPVGSSTGSVLDGPAPMFGGNNIFGHLSDSGSGANSVQDDDDTESNTSSPEEDSENKDPNYEPGEDSGSDSGPGTPVEETGPGIASAKTVASLAPFASGSAIMGSKSGESSDSGASSRSIFDRISRDSNGNPIRQLPTEDKENTQPSTTNPKAPAAPTDQTWSPNSPIRFASTTPTPSNNANPTVSVTEATPTKAPTSNIFGNLNKSGSSSPFPNLFGNSTNTATTSGAPTSNIFGHLNSSGTTTPLPNLFGNSTKGTTLGAPTSAPVGFQFTSATSSLFPSAAVSTTTSRATSPGNTTDGANDDDSATEDPDAEKHEQLDLTAGGPGVEDENIVHEVRAKALQFISAEGDMPGSWKTKGVGPLRLLKHKETGATRLLLRGDPTGNIVFNKSLLAKVKYTNDKKTVKILAAAEGGNGLETWLMQVKTAEMAEALAKALESNKPSD